MADSVLTESGCPLFFLYASLNLERTGQSSTVHTWVVPSLKVPARILRHLRDIVSCYEDLGLTPSENPRRVDLRGVSRIRVYRGLAEIS